MWLSYFDHFTAKINCNKYLRVSVIHGLQEKIWLGQCWTQKQWGVKTGLEGSETLFQLLHVSDRQLNTKHCQTSFFFTCCSLTVLPVIAEEMYKSPQGPTCTCSFFSFSFLSCVHVADVNKGAVMVLQHVVSSTEEDQDDFFFSGRVWQCEC